MCVLIFWYKSVVLFLCLHREDACVSGRSLGGSRRSAPGRGGLGGAQSECWEPPRTLSQRYEHVESSVQKRDLEMIVHTHSLKKKKICPPYFFFIKMVWCPDPMNCRCYFVLTNWWDCSLSLYLKWFVNVVACGIVLIAQTNPLHQCKKSKGAAQNKTNKLNAFILANVGPFLNDRFSPTQTLTFVKHSVAKSENSISALISLSVRCIISTIVHQIIFVSHLCL